MKRLMTCWFFIAAVGVAWPLMMIVHELGHVAGALVTGGEIAGVALHPFEFSQTVLTRNPHPLAVVWLGPIAGIVVPLMAWVLVRRWQVTIGLLLRLFAGFCLIANGIYIGIGWIDSIGDAGDMIRLGSPRWLMVVFGIICCAAGLGCWHGGGRAMGLIGRDSTGPGWRLAVAMTAAWLMLAAILFAFGPLIRPS